MSEQPVLCVSEPTGWPEALSHYDVDANGCWIWNGYVDTNGYAKALDINYTERRRVHWAHRISYVAAKGPIPDGLEIDHLCVVTRCINPDHLETVTRTENIRRVFERNGVNDRDVLAAQLRGRGVTYSEIADALEMSGRSHAFSAIRAAIRKGLVRAEDVPPAPRITDAEREDIRVLYALGIPQGVLAEHYQIDSSQVSRLARGIRSGHKASS